MIKGFLFHELAHTHRDDDTDAVMILAESLEVHLDDVDNFDLTSSHLYILPICLAFVSEDDFMHIDEAIEYPNEIQQHGTVHALLVEKISSNQFIRRGSILSFVSSSDCLKYSDMLKAWKSTRGETIVLV